MYWHHTIFFFTAIYHSSDFTDQPSTKVHMYWFIKEKEAGKVLSFFLSSFIIFSPPFFMLLCFWSILEFSRRVYLWLVFMKRLAPPFHQPSYHSVCCCSSLELQRHSVPLFFRGTKTSRRWSCPWERREPAEKQTHTDARMKKPTHLRKGNHRRPHNHLDLTSTHTSEETLGKLGIIQAVAA